MDVDPKDYTSAACADALVEGLTLYALQAAHDVADSPENFFWAIRASIALKDVCDKHRDILKNVSKHNK
jgi:hypothetical protein